MKCIENILYLLFSAESDQKSMCIFSCERPLNDIKAVPFFSVIVDATQVISQTDQLSQATRCVSIEINVQTRERLRTCEWFIGFLTTDDQSASSLCDTVINNCIKDNGLGLAKLRSQGCDRAASRSGVYSWVQARIAAK